MKKSKSLLKAVIRVAIVLNSCLGSINPVLNTNMTCAADTVPGIDLQYAFNLLSNIANEINNAGGWININGGVLDMLQEPTPVPCRYRYVYVYENDFNYLSRAYKESIGFNPESFVRNPNYYVEAARNLVWNSTPQYIPPSPYVQKKYNNFYNCPSIPQPQYIPPSPYVQKKYNYNRW